MFKCHASNVWFDYEASGKQGRGGRVTSIIIYVYTLDHPKKGEQRPWRKGDDPLYPYEYETVVKEKKTPTQKIHANEYFNCEFRETIAETLLKRYLTKKEVAYYMAHIRREAIRCKDSWTQVIQVIQEKEKQPKFIKGTKQYKRNAIIDYVLKENLKEYGWSLEPPASKKERKALPELFESI